MYDGRRKQRKNDDDDGKKFVDSATHAVIASLPSNDSHHCLIRSHSSASN